MGGEMVITDDTEDPADPTKSRNHSMLRSVQTSNEVPCSPENVNDERLNTQTLNVRA